MACKLWLKVGGVWRDDVALWRKVSGSWEQVKLWRKDSGVWEECGGVQSCDPLTGDAAVFLDPYNPTDIRYTDTNKANSIFPRGRKMLISSWGPPEDMTGNDYTRGQIWELWANAGFTAQGPNNPDTTYSVVYSAFNNYGLQSCCKVRDILQGAPYDLDYVEKAIWLYNNDRDQFRTNIRNVIDLFRAQTGGKDIIAHWDNLLEEVRSDGSGYPEYQDVCDFISQETYSYDKATYGFDVPVGCPEGRGWFMDVDQTLRDEFKYNSSTNKQLYYNDWDAYTNEYRNRIYYRAQMYHILQADSKTSLLLESGGNAYPYPRLISGILTTELGPRRYTPYPIDDYSESNHYWFERETMSDLLTVMCYGMQGVLLYDWQYSNYDIGSDDHYQRAWLPTISKFTGVGLPDVFLWGQKKPKNQTGALSITGSKREGVYSQVEPINSDELHARFSGPYDGYNYPKWIGPAVVFENYQLEDRRYVFLTNQNEFDPMSFTVSGFPQNGQCHARALIAESDSYSVDQLFSLTSGSLSFTLGPLESIVLIVEPICQDGAGATLPDDAATFIANYTSSEEQALVAANPHGLFPNGPNMTLGYYSPEYQHPTRVSLGFPAPRQAILDYGLTLAGPNYGNTFDSSLDAVGPNVEWAFQNNKKVWHHMRPVTSDGYWSASPRSCTGKMGTTLSCDSAPDSDCRYDHINLIIGTSEGQECLRKFFEDHIIKQVSIPSANAAIDGWYVGPDDYNGYSDLSEANLRIYLQIVADAINTYDPKKRPFFMAHRGDYNAGGWDWGTDIYSGWSMQWYQLKKLTYHYLWESEIPAKCGTGQLPITGGDWNWSQYRNAFVYAVQHIKDLYAGKTSYTGKTMPIVPILNDYDEIAIAGYEHNLELTLKWQRHDFWALIAAGAHGINVYSNAYAPAPYTGEEQNQQWLNQFGLLTKNGNYSESISRALLWGQNKTDLNFTITNGARTSTPMNWGGPNIDSADIMCQCPTWQVKNIQYGDRRFILMVNSHPVDTVNVTVSGFPTAGLDLTDMETLSTLDISSGSSSFSLPPHDMRLLEVTVNPAYEQ